MKTLLLTVATVAIGWSSIGQLQPYSTQNLAMPSAAQSMTSVPHSDRSIPVGNQTTLVAPVTGTQGTYSCSMHDLNEQHYASRGLLNEYHQSAMQGTMSAANMNFPETPGSNEISVIFHVVYNPNNPAENVSNTQIMALFQELQEDYQLLNADAANARTGLGFIPADCDINFCLATQDPNGVPLGEVGVVRVSTNEDFYDQNAGEENKMKFSATGGSDIWNRNNYLNVWICNITDTLNYGVAGYAYRPTPSLLPSASKMASS